MINADFKFDFADYLANAENPPVKSLGEILDRGLVHSALESNFRTAQRRRAARHRRRAPRAHQTDGDSTGDGGGADEHRARGASLSDAAPEAGAHRRRPGRQQLHRERALGPARARHPRGLHHRRPAVGIDLLGGAFEEQELLSLGYSIEETLKLRRPPFSTPALVGGKRPAPRTATAYVLRHRRPTDVRRERVAAAVHGHSDSGGARPFVGGVGSFRHNG